MDVQHWETVTRMGKKRSSSPGAISQVGHRHRSRSPWLRSHRDQSCSPPPDRIPSPKSRAKFATGQDSSKSRKRQSYDPSFRVFWHSERAFCNQPGKKDWQERLVQSTEVPRHADLAFIRAGVHVSLEGPDRIQHITVDYQKDSGEHVTTWHIDLSEAEYQSFIEIGQPGPAALAIDPLPSPASDDDALWPPLSP
jgi:hypothetical protein